MVQLLKPDMRAVLDRTNLATNFDAMLLPIFEAGSNSIHSLIDKFGGGNIASEGKLVFSFSIGTTPSEFTVTISDNGNGLDETNYPAFLTPFTGHKLRRGGKGFGRFIAFKVFEEVTYFSKSKPKDGTNTEIKTFKFDVYSNEEITDISGGVAPEFPTGCAVTYRQVKAPYHYQWSQISDQRILDRLSSNFLTYLVEGRMPETLVIIGDNEFDLKSHFATVFRLEKSHTFTLQLRENNFEFRCDVSRVERGKPFSRHALLFFATIAFWAPAGRLKTNLERRFFSDPMAQSMWSSRRSQASFSIITQTNREPR
jgi:hypothetical protein